ncbi:MAG: CPBP family intramembrane metalloprotease [Planctomycetes bacterium]|nr:CPBP family intramembrane metalloprotease [Planctomycetota bacterium]
MTDQPEIISELDPSRDEPGHPHNFFLLTVAFEAGLAAVAVAMGWLVGLNPLATWTWSLSDLGWSLLATLPLLAALWFMDRHPIGPLVQLRQLVQDLVVPLFRDMKLWQLGAIALAAGVGEELLFRGLLQGSVESFLVWWLSPPAAVGCALGLASILFGLGHFLSKTYALLCFFMGLYLGVVWLATGNLLVPIVVHGLYDFLALAYLLRDSKTLD